MSSQAGAIAWLPQDVADAMIGRQIDRPAAAGTADTEPREPAPARGERQTAGSVERRVQLDFLRAPQERVDPSLTPKKISCRAE
jgi:hypothetical protein